MKEKSEFLSNQPLGEDLLKGQSQERVADAIMHHILSEDSKNFEDIKEKKGSSLPRIIGVEGSWGSGKSNMLLRLQVKLKGQYHVFTYDAWGNQEDLQRRSILEMLTDDLIRNEMLAEPTHHKLISTDMSCYETKVCSWKERLFTLVARKSATHNVTIPRIESSTKWFALALLITGIFAALVSSLSFTECAFLDLIIMLFITSLPMVAFCGLRLCKYKKQISKENQERKDNKIEGWAWNEMWKMYQTEGTQDTTTFTVSDLEPSVFEFREWMSDIEGALKNNQRLIIVFDNMDRLPKEKVRILWSSIQTFFAGNGYKKVWCVIPFDSKHLANAFADGVDDDEEKLTNYFIEKTFPVVYRIPAPIITDYRDVFDALFEKAFGKRKEQNTINRCYRLKNAKPNMREIISFINKCVSLEHTWGDEIGLISIAVFVLNRDIILNENTDQTIIDGGYIGMFGKIIEVNEELTTEISSLVYGVEKVQAAQLPLKNIVGKAFFSKEPADFGKFAKENKHFFVILDEETADMDLSLLDTAIKQISQIDSEGIPARDKELLENVWRKMAEMYFDNKLNETTFRPEVKLLMDHSPSKTYKEKIGKKFLELFFSGDKNEHKGEEWYRVYKEFGSYINENGLNLTLPLKKMGAGDYVAYIKVAKAEYKNYPIVTNNDDLNKDLLSRVTDGIDVSDVLFTVQDDERYNFTMLYDGARAMIEGETATNDNVESALSVCKELSKEPLNLNVKLSFLDQLTCAGGVKYDLQVLKALLGKEMSGLDDEEYAQMAKVAYNYESTDEIWDKTYNRGTIVLSKIMAWLITNNVHNGQLKADKDMITGMANIYQRTSVEMRDIVKFVNDWGKKSLNDVEKALSIESVLGNEKWIQALLLEKNDYAKAILRKYYDDFRKRPSSEFIDNTCAWASSSYWLRVLNILIDHQGFISECKEKIIEITRGLVEGISIGNIRSNNPYEGLQSKLLKLVEFCDVSSKVSDAMVRFSNRQSKIDTYMFKNLHHYLEQLSSFEPHFLNYVLNPLINDVEVQKIVIDNCRIYEPLIKKHIAQASDLKESLIELYGTTQIEGLKEFIDRLDIIRHGETSGGSEI